MAKSDLPGWKTTFVKRKKDPLLLGFRPYWSHAFDHTHIWHGKFPELCNHLSLNSETIPQQWVALFHHQRSIVSGIELDPLIFWVKIPSFPGNILWMWISSVCLVVKFIGFNRIPGDTTGPQQWPMLPRRAKGSGRTPSYSNVRARDHSWRPRARESSLDGATPVD